MSISLQTLKEAVQIKEQISQLEARLSRILGGSSSPSVSAPAKKSSGMSAAGRANIIAAQKARWAKVKTKPTESAKPAAKPGKRGKLSAAGRAKIVAALKARWAAKKKGTAAAKPASPSKKKAGLTPEGRARLAATMKARWAARKKAGAPPLNAPKKK